MMASADPRRYLQTNQRGGDDSNPAAPEQLIAGYIRVTFFDAVNRGQRAAIAGPVVLPASPELLYSPRSHIFDIDTERSSFCVARSIDGTYRQLLIRDDFEKPNRQR
jgi:hypothetical protein